MEATLERLCRRKSSRRHLIDDDNLGWVDVDITGGAKAWEGKMALKYSRNPKICRQAGSDGARE